MITIILIAGAAVLVFAAGFFVGAHNVKTAAAIGAQAAAATAAVSAAGSAISKV